jgi:hypothetical protein
MLLYIKTIGLAIITIYILIKLLFQEGSILPQWVLIIGFIGSMGLYIDSLVELRREARKHENSRTKTGRNR